MDTLKAEKKVFIASQHLHRELSQIIQARALQPFVKGFVHKNHILIGTLQLPRAELQKPEKQG